MRSARRLVAALLGLLGTTGTLLCTAGLVGVWVLHADLTDRADRAFGRAGERLGAARTELARAADRLRRTRAEVEAVERREAEAAPPAAKRRPVLPRASAESTSASLVQARQSLVTAVELGLVAGGVLDVLAELPAAERIGVDTARLRGASDQLADLIRTADRFAAALPGGPDEPDAGIAERVDRVVSTLDEAAGQVDDARGRVADWHRRTARALAVAAAGATAVLVWIGLGQACLAWQGGRGALRQVTPARTA